MYGEGRIAGVIEIFKRSFSFCERTGAFSLIKTKIVKKSVKKSVNLQASKIKASRTKTAWKSAENSKKTAEKSVNLRANFDKNKKASRIKALREFTMKRLTDFFGEKG